ncbi:hypothetical protein [Thalassospira marina]|uniref:hypothetical protein n=1 Tax=Thalassospira marina TaxID=2048283 RepID=UPI001054436D|nr:hypothetical protein [Thalassospira marina]
MSLAQGMPALYGNFNHRADIIHHFNGTRHGHGALPSYAGFDRSCPQMQCINAPNRTKKMQKCARKPAKADQIWNISECRFRLEAYQCFPAPKGGLVNVLIQVLHKGSPGIPMCGVPVLAGSRGIHGAFIQLETDGYS